MVVFLPCLCRVKAVFRSDCWYVYIRAGLRDLATGISNFQLFHLANVRCSGWLFGPSQIANSHEGSRVLSVLRHRGFASLTTVDRARLQLIQPRDYRFGLN